MNHIHAMLNFTSSSLGSESFAHGEYVGYVEENAPGGKELKDVRVPCERLVLDARQFIEYPLRLSSVGFELAEIGNSDCTNFLDRDEVLRVYVPEIEAVVRTYVETFLRECNVYRRWRLRSTRVWDACVRDGQVRNEFQNETSGGVDELAPVPLVHGDFYGDFAAARLKQLLTNGGDTLCSVAFPLEKDTDPLDMEAYTSGALPLLSINVWRSIDRRQPVKSSPLAMCDPRLMREQRRVSFEINCPDVVVEEAHFLPPETSEQESWFYWPEMEHRECLLFFTQGFMLPSSSKISDESKRQRQLYNASVPHTSFELPCQATDAPARRSIECRAFVFLEKVSSL
eukprot:TRINITY_DN22915_c0_g2_i1.p1 TRINITY_DN22915_c0_g2~~TRINITY_DN22915_c0_g2_i1.p1  ORF type:complete len:342 (-),score=51.57 TRINITY_DN22915_c0_g2_i1:37-1062(-)